MRRAMTVPDEAVVAAAEVLKAWLPSPKFSVGGRRVAAYEMLRDAAPLIAAAERERIAALAEQVDARWTDLTPASPRAGIPIGDGRVSVPFADLLREPS